MVGILIITHNNIGVEILKSAEAIMGKSLPRVKTVSIPSDLSADKLGYYADQIKMHIEQLERGKGVLVLTDLLGSTPSNLANYFAEDHHVKIISGVNLPMLIRIINYAEQPLELLAKIGIVGANKGITKENEV
ncbi:MAG: PTS fructose transporter subunit IIA [Gammaproteobacteria bacterium]|nr:PTS fructose transporter subunit IIA [Gammaproteobacteria bacterium]